VKSADNDKYPNLNEKEALRISTTTTLRRREPTNQNVSAKFPSMVWDHREQMAIIPYYKPNSYIESTQSYSKGTPKTMNKSGRPYALDTFVGGSPDTRGNLHNSPRSQFMTERAKK
jgi:hypothetical protein